MALIVQNGESKVYLAGEVILHEGSINQSLFWVSSGSLSVRKRDDSGSSSRLIATIGAGRFIGELSLLDKSVITATVVAETRVELVILPLTILLNLFEAYPGLSKRFHRRIAVSLAEKVRAMGGKKNGERGRTAAQQRTRFCFNDYTHYSP